jgi:translation initiation factor 1 (eIF-1/SUI1)
MKAQAKELKKAVGAGGAIKDGALEIQSEKREAVVAKRK